MKTINSWLLIIGSTLLLCGCISSTSTVYRDAEPTKVQFESDAAARLFYETLSKYYHPHNRSEKTVRFDVPLVFSAEKKEVRGRNLEFNEAVAECDTDKNGVITEQEARIFANRYR